MLFCKLVVELLSYWITSSPHPLGWGKPLNVDNYYMIKSLPGI